VIASPLLINVRHRAMITTVSPLLTGLIHTSPSCWTIFSSFEIILETGTVHWIGFKCNVLYKSIASKNIKSDMNYVSKMT